MYETLKLIRDMGRAFSADEMFQAGLRLLLKDANALEQAHLKAARHKAVFHFDAKKFKETIDQGLLNGCLFVYARGRSREDVHYSYADIAAAEILVGFSGGGLEFEPALIHAMKTTEEVATTFVEYAEKLIHHHLNRWGFVPTSQSFPDPSAAP